MPCAIFYSCLRTIPASPFPTKTRQGDHDTVNCLESHPHHLLTVATSGIEDSIKLWTPSAEEPQVGRVPIWYSLGSSKKHAEGSCDGAQPTALRLHPKPTPPQVIGEAEERLMAANQRNQGEERRMFLSPQMLQVGSP